jgi:hypothetical protein
MRRKTLFNWFGMAAIALLAAAAMTASARADDDYYYDDRDDYEFSGQAGVRVWVDGGDIFADYDDVSVYLRADRDCYTTLFLVDTAGYLHVLYPSTPHDRVWMRGGRTYRYYARDLGLDRLDGVGVAHLYAVGSPVPFDYSYYGASIFVGGFGFRIYGDPYVACHDFYVSLLPVSCRWDFVAVSSARFYVREWVRYPSYLCSPGRGVHVRIGDGCRECSNVYASYRGNVASPYEVLRPEPRKFKKAYASDRVAAPVGRVEHARAKAGDDSRRNRGQSDVFVRGAQRTEAKVVERSKKSVERSTKNVERSTKSVGRATEPRQAGVDRVKVVSTSRSGNAAQRTVKTSDRKSKVSESVVKKSADNSRVVRKATVTTKKSSVTKKSGTATNRKGAGKRVRQAQ